MSPYCSVGHYVTHVHYKQKYVGEEQVKQFVADPEHVKQFVHILHLFELTSFQYPKLKLFFNINKVTIWTVINARGTK